MKRMALIIAVVGACFSLAMAGNYYREWMTLPMVAAGPTVAGIVAHWTMNDNAASVTIADVSGNNHAGVASQNSSAMSIAGKTGTGAIQFNGTSDNVSVTNHAHWEFGTDNFSVCWWEKIYGNKTASLVGTAISRDAITVYPAPWLFGYTYGSTDTNRVIYMSSGSGWDMASGKVLGSALTNVWTHFAIIRSGSNFKTYCNGVEKDSWTSTASIMANSNPLSIGKTQGNGYLWGAVDDVRIYRVAITTNSLAWIYNGGSGREEE